MSKGRDKYDSMINSKWPEGMKPPSPKEAITGAKRLYRFAMKRPRKGEVKLTSGNRYTWISGRVMLVNPNRNSWHTTDGGWREIVHSLSHVCNYWLNPKDRPHSHRQLRLEASMCQYVLEHGFLEGKLKRKSKPKPTKLEQHQVELEKVDAIIKKWESKKRRANTALKKWRAKLYQMKKKQPSFTLS